MVRMFVPALVPLLLLLPARDAPFHALVADQLGVETRLPKDGRRRFARVVPAHDLDLKAIGIPDMGWAHAFDRWQAGQIRTLLCCEFAINHFFTPPKSPKQLDSASYRALSINTLVKTLERKTHPLQRKEGANLQTKQSRHFPRIIKAHRPPPKINKKLNLTPSASWGSPRIRAPSRRLTRLET